METMQLQLGHDAIDAGLANLALGVEDLEELEVPGFWEGAAGVAVGVFFGYVAFSAGVLT